MPWTLFVHGISAILFLMTKPKFSLILTIVLVVMVGLYALFNRDEVVETSLGVDPLNTTYIIEGQSVKLANGLAEQTIQGSVSKIVTQAFGKPFYGDLDGNGLKDSVMFLTQSGGGSGEFYYATIALNKNALYEGLEGVFLGDRIAPQNIQIKDGVAIVNYADRKAGEPLTVQPSVGVSKYLVIEEGIAKETSNFSQGDLLFSGGLVKGEGVRVFTPCGGLAKWVVGSSTTYKKLMNAYENRVMSTNPYEPLYVVLAGKIVDAPKDGFGADYDLGIEVTELIKVIPGGKCQ